LILVITNFLALGFHWIRGGQETSSIAVVLNELTLAKAP